MYQEMEVDAPRIPSLVIKLREAAGFTHQPLYHLKNASLYPLYEVANRKVIIGKR
jgi:hypothetical protein